jgi:hypothetical protein
MAFKKQKCTKVINYLTNDNNDTKNNNNNSNSNSNNNTNSNNIASEIRGNTKNPWGIAGVRSPTVIVIRMSQFRRQ